MVSKKLIKRYKDNHPEHADWSDETIDNFLEQRRDLDICGLCPVSARGLCCYSARAIPLPSKQLCDNCTTFLRGKCEYDRSDIPEKSKFYHIILPKHPCKFLNQETKMCSVYENRFWDRRTCMTIKDAIAGGVVPKNCAYLVGKKKKKYAKGAYKLFYDEVEDELCEWGKLTWLMENDSPHEGKYGNQKY